jgi:hypothetical protein
MVEELSKRVELYISCRELTNLDGLFGKSDPYIVIKQFKPYSQNEFDVIGKTELIKNNLNPEFDPVKVQYFFEKQQRLHFECFDSGKGGESFEMIGIFETTMAKICGSKGQIVEGIFTMPDKEKERGKISIRAVTAGEGEANPGKNPPKHPEPV